MSNRLIRYYGAALLAMFFWSFSFIWFKIAYRAYGPMSIVFFRLTLSAAIMFVFATLVKKLEKIQKGDLAWMILLAFFEPFLYFMGESFGLTYISPTVASVVVATVPVITPLAAWYFLKETVSVANFLGLILSFIGVTLVVLDSSGGLSASPLGVSLEFLAVLSTIGYAIVLKRLTFRYNGYTIISYQNLFGAVMFMPFWILFESARTIQTPFNAEAFSAIVKLAVFASILGFTFFTYSVRYIGINKSNMFVNLIPVFVTVFSFIILGDKIDFQKAVGIAVVVAGLFLAQLRKRRVVAG